MNQSFISEITKKLKDERGVKDKELDADRKEKHMEEKFKPEEGAFGEASSELDRVVTAMAESRVLYLSRESGKPVRVRDGWRSAVLAQYRRQAACLTARLGNLGEGARQAAGRRGKVM